MDPVGFKREHVPEVVGIIKKQKVDPVSARIVALALDKFVAAGILTDEQRSSFSVRLLTQEREQWYSETLSRIAEMLHSLSLGKLKIFKSALPERISEDRFDTLKREIIFEYGWHIHIMLRDCAEANLDEYEVVEIAGREPLLPAGVKERGPTRSTTLPKLLTPLYLFFQQRKWLVKEYQQIQDDLERVLLHVWKKEHPHISDTEGLRALPLCNQIWQLMHHEDFSRYTQAWKEQAVLRLKDICKPLSRVDFNSRHLSISADPAQPFLIESGLERIPEPLAQHLQFWMQENQVTNILKEAPAYPALIEKLYQRARSLLEGWRLHEELIACRELWNISGLKVPLDVTYYGIFKDRTYEIPSHQALTLSKSSPLFKAWNTRADKKLKVPLTKAAFDALYKAFLYPQHDCDSILAVFKSARICQMDQFVHRLFRDLLFCLNKCADLSDVTKLENSIQKADCFDAHYSQQWQKERDSRISNLLDNLDALEDMLKMQQGYAEGSWRIIRSLKGSSTNPGALALLAELSGLEELEIDALPSLSRLAGTSFSRLQSLTVTRSQTHWDGNILTQWLARPCLKKLTITLQSSEILENFLELIPAHVTLDLRIVRQLTNLDIPLIQRLSPCMSLDITCAALNPFSAVLKELPQLKLRLVGQHADRSELQQLQQMTAVRLLELRAAWSSHPDIWESIRHLQQLELLCLGQSGSAKFIASAEAASVMRTLSHLKMLELQLKTDEISSLPHTISHPIKELTIKVLNDSLNELPIGICAQLFTEKLHLHGKWRLGSCCCTEFLVLKQQERAVLSLSKCDVDAEDQIVNQILAPAFATLRHITLNWNEDISSSVWTSYGDGSFNKHVASSRL